MIHDAPPDTVCQLRVLAAYAGVPEQRLTFLPLYYAAEVGDARPGAA